MQRHRKSLPGPGVWSLARAPLDENTPLRPTGQTPGQRNELVPVTFRRAYRNLKREHLRWAGAATGRVVVRGRVRDLAHEIVEVRRKEWVIVEVRVVEWVVGWGRGS